MAEGKHVFGPVPSRRLGRSMGIDPVPTKTCNFNCVYCQIGRTKPLVNRRKEFFDPQEIVNEVSTALAAHPNGTIDWLTFIGSGETCLHSRLGWMIREVRKITSLPIAVITNGSLFNRSGVRPELAAADAVLPSLDAGSADVFRRINRPHPDFTFERHVAGLAEFRRIYQGRFWLEIMLVQGVNDTVVALRDIQKAVKSIAPDEVHISLPTRPPAEAWVGPPDQQNVMKALNILGETSRVIPPVGGEFELAGCDGVVEAVLRIITRHPMRQEELESSLSRWSTQTVRDAIADLESSGRVKVVSRLGSRFWSASRAEYSDLR